MTNPLGTLVVSAGAAVVRVIDFVYGVVTAVIDFIFNVTRSIMENVFYQIAKLLDKKGVEAREQGIELHIQHMELQLLSSASKVRDHAGDSDGWTDYHTEAINAVGNALMEECSWDERDIHLYLKEIVESVDGLTYNVFLDDQGDML